jgi:hypothetical protein
MEDMIPYILLSALLVICSMPAVIWWFIKYLPMIVLGISRLCLTIIAIIGFIWLFKGVMLGGFDCVTVDWEHSSEPTWSLMYDHPVEGEGKAIVVEDDER